MSTAAFTPETTRQVLETATWSANLDSTDAKLVKLGENALFRLASAPVIARIGRSPEAGYKETHVARWLADHRFPSVRLAEIEQPVYVDDLVVTFWEVVDQADPAATAEELGTMLRKLRDLPAPPGFSLPPFDPMPKVESRLHGIGGRLSDKDREFFRGRRLDLMNEFTKLEFVLGYGPTHGDYHAGNLMRDRSGTVKLIDFEDFCWGPREWDASVQAVRYQAFDWVSDDDYRTYVKAYGFNPLEWDGFPVIPPSVN